MNLKLRGFNKLNRRSSPYGQYGPQANELPNMLIAKTSIKLVKRFIGVFEVFTVEMKKRNGYGAVKFEIVF